MSNLVGEYLRAKEQRDELLEAAKKLERVVRLGIPQDAVPLIAEHGLWDEFVVARIHIAEAIEKAEGRE